MRLTRNDVADIYNGYKIKGMTKQQAIDTSLEELYEYKEVEEELGIDLLTLFKALKNDIAVKNKDGKIETFWACPRFQISIDKSDSWILYGPVEEQKYVSIKDYGKTWALTKEELK